MMHIGDKVRINRGQEIQRKGYTEWRTDATPKSGIVVYISPHGWATVMTLSNDAVDMLYRECFYYGDLEVVH